MPIIQARRLVSQSEEPFDYGKISLEPPAHLSHSLFMCRSFRQ